jgi:hypothetical protein
MPPKKCGFRPAFTAGEDVTIEDLSGTGCNDLLAVTTDGYAACFDGSSWHLLDLPSHAGLNQICRLRDGRYAIAGYNSTLLIGQRDQWQRVAPLKQDRNYYGVASWRSDVFVASLGNIDVFNGTALRRVPIPQPKRELAILASGPDGVWSLCGHTIGMVSAAGWRDVP